MSMREKKPPQCRTEALVRARRNAVSRDGGETIISLTKFRVGKAVYEDGRWWINPNFSNRFFPAEDFVLIEQ